jgi:hypothetical protein
MPYSLAEGFDNAAGFVEIIDIFVDARRLAHITSLGSYQAAREIVGLDGITRDDGYDTFQWSFEWMSPAEVEYLQTTFLDGARSGPVTVETRDNYGDFVERNAILTMPKSYTLRGIYYGDVVLTFTRAEATA